MLVEGTVKKKKLKTIKKNQASQGKPFKPEIIF
jgi:hypothetical protein